VKHIFKISGPAEIWELLEKIILKKRPIKALRFYMEF